jgi:hypothetical protein
MSHTIPQLMPPFLDEELVTGMDRKNSDTIFSGKSAESIIAGYLLRNKINYAEPAIDQGNDFWVEENGVIKRAQVKKVVFKMKLDVNVSKRRGFEVRRPTFDFRFQSAGASNSGRKFYGPSDIDVFYHVLYTPFRELIFKINSNEVPLDKNGHFLQAKSAAFDRSFTQRKIAEIDYAKALISSKYDVRLIQENPDFFFPQSQQTVMDFFE